MVAYSPSGEPLPEPAFATERTLRVVEVSEDGRRMLAAYEDGGTELRDLASGELLASFAGRQGADERVALALDRSGRRIAYLAGQRGRRHTGRVHVVEAAGTEVDVIDIDTLAHGEPMSLHLSEDGGELVISTLDGVALWYELDGMGHARIAEPGSGFDARFLDEGKVAVVGSEGVLIVDPTAPESPTRLGKGSAPARVAIDPTGRLVATADPTGLVQLWEVRTGSPIGEPFTTPAGSPVHRLRFGPDGQILLIVGPTDATWMSVSPEDWRTLACNLAGEVSIDDMVRYLGSVGASEACS